MKFFYTYYQKLIIILYALCYYTSHFFKRTEKLLINYNGFFKEEEHHHTNDVIKSVPFENKYLEEFHKLKSVSLSADKIESLSNSYLMVSTPVGNIAMYYDNKKEAFLYYSDSVVPFRYLEPVGRKYVIMFQCKDLFHDKDTAETTTPTPQKPMKTKDILNGIKNPQKKLILVEKKTNRYTCMGRYSNFKMIKPVDKTVVDKNYSMTFSDFKKMTTNKTLI